MAGRFDGRVALVTGAASGIGEATARRFAAEGARVAIEYARHGVRAVAICPGAIATPPLVAFANAVDGAGERMARASPFRRLGRPEEIAAVVCFLASDEASFISGTAVVVDGASLATKEINVTGLA